jgi:predicted CDP-diglyceride synthetase/phosphatidate cytidylyltransferase
LIYLHQLPRWVPPLVLAGLLLAGLAVPGWGGAAALVVVAAFLGWLAALSWPRLTSQARLLRVAGFCCALALAVYQAAR